MLLTFNLDWYMNVLALQYYLIWLYYLMYIFVYVNFKTHRHIVNLMFIDTNINMKKYSLIK